MLWTHPLLLAGLGALAAPVLIHLLMKVQGRKVLFSTLRFLPPTKPARERKKIRHWPLLLLRLFLLALLVAAFARPYWPSQSGTAAPHERARGVVIVLDRSASMQAREGSTTRWEAARAAARKVLNDLSETDQVALVDFAGPAEVVTPWGPRADAARALAHLQVSSEPGQLADGLRVAATLLDQAPSSPELILISDLQKSSCSGLDSALLPAGARCQIQPVAGPATANVAVTGVVSKGSTTATLAVDLQNFSAHKLTGLPVSCSLDRQPFFQGKIDLDGNGTGELALPALAAAPGWHRLQIDLYNDDALTGDNHFFAAVFVPQPIQIVVAEPHLEMKNYERTSYFLTSALNPEFSVDDPPVSPSAPGPFNVTLVDPVHLPAALAATPRPAVTVLPPLAEIPAGLGGALKKYLESGGGLLGWVGPEIDTLGYTNELGTIWPARLIGPETYDGVDASQGWRLGWWNRDSPLFGPVGEGGQGDLTLPQFKERMRLELKPGADVLATFEDRVPFLISGQVGTGRVLLVNSGVDTRGSDWPIHKTYLPLVQRMAYYLARQNPQAGFSLGRSLTPTRRGQLDLGVARARQPLQLVSPGGAAVSIRTDEAGVAHGVNLEQPGCYEVRNVRNEVENLFSVNFPVSESDLAGYRPDEITSQLHFAASATSRFSSAEEGTFSARREMWPWLLALLLPLLFVELAWANRIRA